METGALLAAAGEDAGLLLEAAEGNWTQPVPACPGWDVAELVRHTGSVFLWQAAVVSGGERISRRGMAPAPEEPAELGPWFAAAGQRVLEVLGSADPERTVWTFAETDLGGVAWWCRRMAVEVAVHRWDVQQAAVGRAPTPLDGVVAAAGVEEFVLELLPGLLGQGEPPAPRGSLHLHALDAPLEFWIDLDDGGLARSGHAKADAVVRGTRSELMLWLSNRGPLPGLELIGDSDLLDHWKYLKF